jgi:two-component system, NarL family, sensor kinase
MFNTKEEAYFSMIFATLFALLLIIIIIIAAVLYYNRRKKNLLERQQLQFRFDQTLLQSQLEIQEQTLKNISQEIHDNIGQALTLAKLNLNTILPSVDESLRENILASKHLVSKAIGDLRDLSRSLDTDYVKEMGLQRAIEYEMEMIQKTGTIRALVQVEGTIIRLEKQDELILFRIIQESFHNILKHAEARNLLVNVRYSPEELEFSIRDDGRGMDLSPLNDKQNADFGLGIRNMQKRAKLIGAVFTMQSVLGSGTEVKIILPVENKQYENKI